MASLASTANLLQLVGEPSRVRLLALLGREELTAAELGSVTELSQSRVSTHLGKLREAGLVREQRVAGGTTVYALANGEMPAEARRLWETVTAGLEDETLESDRARCAAVLRARKAAAAAAPWPDSVAGEMERHYSPGRTWEAVARGLFGLLDLGDVLDAGAGDGAIAQLLAPRARTVTCLDQSETLIDAARARLRGLANVRCVVGDLQAKLFAAGSFDQTLLLNVLTSVRAPARAIAACAGALRPGGTLVAVTLAAHDHLDVTRAYGHVHPGFAPAALRRLLGRAGLSVDACAITSRERRSPYFQVLTAFATKRGAARADEDRSEDREDGNDRNG